jgi:acyl carrier protein
MTRNDALQWLATVFDEPPENIKLDTPRDEISGWDSFGVLTLMADIDEKFGVQLTEKDSRGMKVVMDIFTFLERNGASFA